MFWCQLPRKLLLLQKVSCMFQEKKALWNATLPELPPGPNRTAAETAPPGVQTKGGYETNRNQHPEVGCQLTGGFHI